MSSSDDGPFPGWYPDPGDPGRVRWWDGNAWTDETTNAAGGALGYPEEKPKRSGWQIFGIVLLVIFGTLAALAALVILLFGVCVVLYANSTG